MARIHHGTTATFPNWRKCTSNATSVVMPSRSITTRLTQSVKLQSLSRKVENASQPFATSV